MCFFLCEKIAIGTDDVYKTAEAVKLSGGKVTREPGPLPGINTKITACLDPDGWKSVSFYRLFTLHALTGLSFTQCFLFLFHLICASKPTKSRIKK